MDIDLLMKRLSKEAEALPDILAPVLSSRVVVMVNNHPYILRVTTKDQGWFVLHPNNTTSASIVREAYPYEIEGYFQKLPRLTCIVCRRLQGKTWLVYPFNTSDAKQKTDLEFPRPMHLVLDNVEPFFIIRGGLLGTTVLYRGIYDSRQSAELGQELEKKTSISKLKNVNPEFRAVYAILEQHLEEERKQTVVGKIEDAVGYLGAELVSFKEKGEGYIVRWKDQKETHEVTVGKDLKLLSAGICLSGRESQQSLSSTIAVMRRYGSRYSNDYDD